MSDLPGAGDALAAIHAAFAVPVLYIGAGLDREPVAAVKSDVRADTFIGPGETLRQTSFEVFFGDLPENPSKDDLIEEDDGTIWRVIDVTRRGDVSAWDLVVELGQ